MDPQTRLALVTAAASTLDAAAGLVRAETQATTAQIDPIVKQLLDSVEHILGLVNPITPPVPAAAPARPTGR